MKQYRFWLRIGSKVIATFDLPEERAEKFARFIHLPFPGPDSMRESLEDNFELIMKEIAISQRIEPIVTSQP